MNRRSFLRSAIAAALAPAIRPLYRLVAPLPTAVLLYQVEGQTHFPVMNVSGLLTTKARLYPFYKDGDSLVVYSHEYSSSSIAVEPRKSFAELMQARERDAVRGLMQALQRKGDIPETVHGLMPDPGQLARIRG